MSEDQDKLARRRIWQSRRRKFAIGVNTTTALLLAVVLWGMVNYLASRHYTRIDVSQSEYYKLSEKSQVVLDSLTNQVDVAVLFSEDHELFRDISNLLKEYETRSKLVNIEYVDPHRKQGRTKQLRDQYDLSETDVVVFASGDRKVVLTKKDIGEHQASENRFEFFR